MNGRDLLDDYVFESKHAAPEHEFGHERHFRTSKLDAAYDEGKQDNVQRERVMSEESKHIMARILTTAAYAKPSEQVQHSPSKPDRKKWAKVRTNYDH